MLPCVLPMIIHRQTWIQNKITDSKKTVSDTDTITSWDQKKNVQITGTKKKNVLWCSMPLSTIFQLYMYHGSSRLHHLFFISKTKSSNLYKMIRFQNKI